MSKSVARDPSTGFAIPLPPDWVIVEGAPFAALLYDGEGEAAGVPFVTNLAAVVYPESGDIDLDVVVHRACMEWLDVTATGHVIQIEDLDDGAVTGEDVSGQLVYASYSTGLASVTVLTAILLSAGIVTRIDLSVDAGLSRVAEEAFRSMLSQVTLPETAPAAAISAVALSQFMESATARRLARR